MSFYETHLKLFEFFGGYLNQNWLEIYRWDGQAPDYEPIVRKFKSEKSIDDLEETIAQLEDLLATGRGFDDDAWLDALVYDLGLGLRPQAFGLTHPEWLEKVLEILKRPRGAEAGQFIPERI